MTSDELSDQTPTKYQAETRYYEQKDWLYEHYWGQLKSQNEIADQIEQSRKKVRMELDRHSIPTRGENWNNSKANPFAGFYNPDEIPPAPENTRQYYDEDLAERTYEDIEKTHTWIKEAASDDHVSLDWHRQYSTSD